MRGRQSNLTRSQVRAAVQSASRWPGGPYPERYRTGADITAPVRPTARKRGFWDESPEEAMSTNQTIVPIGGERPV